MDAILIAQRKQRLVWTTVTALIGLLGLAQRDQRGLLDGPEAPIAASAFAAITPQTPGLAIVGGGSGGAAGRNAGVRRGGAGTGTPQFAAPAGSVVPATGAPASAFDQPAAGTDGAPAAPSALLALADPGSGAINPGPGSSGIGGIPTISPGGPQQLVSGAAPGAVPEAPLWAIMILGIGGIGCIARRERARGRSLVGAQIA